MRSIFFAAFCMLMIACNNSNSNPVNETAPVTAVKDTTVAATESERIADAATIMSRPQVPVLCYHNIRNKNESYSVSPEAFASQMKILSDSGYQTVLPDDLYNYLAFGKALPAKPVMITFDDTDLEQFTLGYTEMKKYNFKGVFFIMTIAIGKPRYMTKDILKQLAEEGNAIESHTWDHNMVTKYDTAAWDKQITGASATIQNITGKPVRYFAYPFGLWNTSSFTPLKERNIKMAFQLSTRRDSTEPLYTVRRMIVPYGWTSQGMLKAMKTTFNK